MLPYVRTARTVGSRRSMSVEPGVLDRVADLAQDRADLRAKEDEGDDRDDRNQSEDQRVLGETLTLFVFPEGRDKSGEERHVDVYLLSPESPPTKNVEGSRVFPWSRRLMAASQ